MSEGNPDTNNNQGTPVPNSQEQANTNGEGTPDTTPNTPDSTAPVDPNSLFSEQLSAITTSDGRQKYADVSKALSSIPHAQDHINGLTQQIKDLEKQLEDKKNVDAVLERLDNLGSQATPTESPSNQGIDATTLDAMLEAKLQQREIVTQQTTNANQVLNSLKERFGDSARIEFDKKASELGMTPGQLSDIARQSPKAALAFFPNSAPQPTDPATGTVNTNNLNGSPPTDDSHMKIFNGTGSESIQKWRTSAVEE